MASLHDVEFRLSGGASNTTPSASIGGAISTVSGGLILSQASTALTTLGGITINDVYGCDEGTATWTWNASAATLTFQPPGSTAGTAVSLSASGEYVVQGAGTGVVGTALITVDTALLPSSNITNTSTISNQLNKIYADITKDQADTGVTIYRAIYLKNASASTIKGFKLWIEEQTEGEDVINIGLSAQGKNGTITAPVDMYTAPAAVTFGDYSSETLSLSVGDLATTDYYGIWLRLTVPAGVTTAVAENRFTIGVYCRV